jgi:hypothetical protein
MLKLSIGALVASMAPMGAVPAKRRLVLMGKLSTAEEVAIFEEMERFLDAMERSDSEWGVDAFEDLGGPYVITTGYGHGGVKVSARYTPPAAVRKQDPNVRRLPWPHSTLLSRLSFFAAPFVG